MNPSEKMFQNEPVTALKHKKLKELIGSNKIQNNIVKRMNKSTLKPGKCSLCFGNTRTLCCNTVITTLTYKSQQTQKKNVGFFTKLIVQEHICLDGIHVM